MKPRGNRQVVKIINIRVWYVLSGPQCRPATNYTARAKERIAHRITRNQESTNPMSQTASHHSHSRAPHTIHNLRSIERRVLFQSVAKHIHGRRFHSLVLWIAVLCYRIFDAKYNFACILSSFWWFLLLSVVFFFTLSVCLSLVLSLRWLFFDAIA